MASKIEDQLDQLQLGIASAVSEGTLTWVDVIGGDETSVHLASTKFSFELFIVGGGFKSVVSIYEPGHDLKLVNNLISSLPSSIVPLLAEIMSSPKSNSTSKALSKMITQQLIAEANAEAQREALDVAEVLELESTLRIEVVAGTLTDPDGLGFSESVNQYLNTLARRGGQLDSIAYLATYHEDYRRVVYSAVIGYRASSPIHWSEAIEEQIAVQEDAWAEIGFAGEEEEEG